MYLDVFPSLAEALGMEGTMEEVLSEQEIEAGYSLRDLLNRLFARYHRFDQIVFDVNSQELTEEVVIFINGRNINLVDGLESRLSDGDALTIVPYMEGG